MRQVLGTCTEAPKKKKHSRGYTEDGDKREKGEAPDEMVYRDSSTFLKVLWWLPKPN